MDYTGKVISKNPPQPTQASASGVWTLDEAAAAVRNNNWPIVGVPNPISKSLRFNNADSATLTRTPASASNRKTWTWSGWVKRGKLGIDSYLFSSGTGASNVTLIRFVSSDILRIYTFNSDVFQSQYLDTNAVFRDPSAWYHIVGVHDTTQAVTADRLKLYVNGVQQTGTTTGAVNQNTNGVVNSINEHILGPTSSYSTQLFDGYMTEVNFIDGQALTPSSFGQTNPNTGVWEPIRYTGTYGTNGFYLNFKDSSSISALGYDYSGNGNNWNANNFSVTAGAGNDSLTDVPTSWTAYTVDNVDSGGVVRGNYCTWNPLERPDQSSGTYTVTLSNGNLDTAAPGSEGSALNTTLATFQIPTTGKWYWEILVTNVATAAPTRSTIGIMNQAAKNNDGADMYYAAVAGVYAYSADGQKAQSYGTLSSYGNSYTNNDIISVAVDSDDGKIWFAKNGTWQNSGSPTSGTNAAFTGLVMTGGFQPATGYWLGCTANFGQRPFAYTPPSGYKSLCTTNLPTPVIGATSTTQADDYFNTILYTGNNTTQTVTVGFQPDLTWVKRIDAAASHNWADVIRGATNGLSSDTNGAAYTITGFNSFISTGFQLAADTTAQVNANGGRYASWNWKGGGTGVSNTSGSISSTVSANTDAGFSVVTYTGTGANATVGHGCKVNNVATAPSMVIIKRRSAADAWYVYHTGLTSAVYALQLNGTGAESSLPTIFNSTAPTSTLFSIGTDSAVNANTATYVAYCFAAVSGYSAFGKYTGNGSTDGPFIYTGFRPEWILIKPSSIVDTWQIEDTLRSPFNVVNDQLFPSSAAAEQVDSATRQTDFLSNGFKIRGTNGGINQSSATYIYAAFAESPFKYALAR